MASPNRKVVPVSGASQTINSDAENGSSEIVVFVTANTSTVNLPNPTGFAARLLVKKMSSQRDSHGSAACRNHD